MEPNDHRVTAGLLNLSDTGRFLGVPRQTLARWAHGDDRATSLLHVVTERERREAQVSFVALAEAYVLQALREAGVRTERIRPALERLKSEFGREYVLVARELATDGVEVLWDFARTNPEAGLIAARSGQHVMREIVADYLQYLTWDDAGDPLRLVLRHCLPSRVVADPERAFGQPIFEDHRVRVGDVAAMLRAGEEPEIVADEFGITIDDVRTAARVLLGYAA